MKKTGNIYKIETGEGFEMSVQESKCYSTGSYGRIREPDEISFLISGYNSMQDTDVEIVVSIPKEEAKELITALQELSQ